MPDKAGPFFSTTVRRVTARPATVMVSMPTTSIQNHGTLPTPSFKKHARTRILPQLYVQEAELRAQAEHICLQGWDPEEAERLRATYEERYGE